MKIVIAPDSFKGSLSSAQVIDRIAQAALDNFPDCEIVRLPMADGGEGTIDALIEIMQGTVHHFYAKDALGREISAKYGVIPPDTAIIEMAAVNGLPQVPPEARNPLYTSSYGTGQMIRQALQKGFSHIIVTIGGSATNDGGIGAMSALGVDFLDCHGAPLKPVGMNLENICDIHTEGLDPLLKKARITVMCDVDNPLLGPNGATYMYGTQKGGTTEILDRLENGMKNYADVLEEKLGISIHQLPGGGAAGGISAALVAFTGAKLQSGITTVLDTIHFQDILKDADLVITGEGRLDRQSFCGKVIHGIGDACRKSHVPVIAIVGGIDRDIQLDYADVVNSIMVTVDGAIGLPEALSHADTLLTGAADRMFKMIKVGMELSKSNTQVNKEDSYENKQASLSAGSRSAFCGHQN